MKVTLFIDNNRDLDLDFPAKPIMGDIIYFGDATYKIKSVAFVVDGNIVKMSCLADKIDNNDKT